MHRQGANLCEQLFSGDFRDDYREGRRIGPRFSRFSLSDFTVSLV